MLARADTLLTTQIRFDAIVQPNVNDMIAVRTC